MMTDEIGPGREIIPSKSSDILDASYSDNSCSTLVIFFQINNGKKGGSSKVHYGTHYLRQSKFNNRPQQSNHSLFQKLNRT
jgi:hypothetical protein